RHSDKWRRGGLVPAFDRVRAGDGAVVTVDRPARFLPLRKAEGTWNSFVTGRHARHLLEGAADPERRRLAYFWHPRFWPYARLLAADYVVLHVHDAWDATAWPPHLQ